MARLLNAEDFRGAARKRLPKGLFEYIDRGTEAELAMADIRHSLDRIKFRQSVLSGHSQCDMTTELFGHHYPAPLIVAPTALAGLVSYDGEYHFASRPSPSPALMTFAKAHPMRNFGFSSMSGKTGN